MAFLLAAFAAPLAHTGIATGQMHLGSRIVAPPLADGVPLRIMPLGASITWGQASSDGNGYRGVLRDMLANSGNPVNMVGSQHHGTMVDNDNEGWPGYVIDQVYAKANASVPAWKPNVILVNAGTNDCSQDRNVGHAGERMLAMLEQLFVLSPRATVLLSSLVVNKNATTERQVVTVNEQYRTVAEELKARGRRLVYVEMQNEDGPQKGDLSDNTHPNDKGYRKMAILWYNALVDASRAGLLQAPEPVEGLPDDGGGGTQGRHRTSR
ncbi:SGNH hydrolase-type esterase domain-containing protein [Coniochaeta sp. 2T2.1]|nr:SGNH hydrolase-type esterase domain-containing protein [Coniochaeta sp. 2T2.1]